jgi:hypothetical protein
MSCDRKTGIASALDQPNVNAKASTPESRNSISNCRSVEKGLTALNKPNGRIAYSFHARDLHLVMGLAAQAKPVRKFGATSSSACPDAGAVKATTPANVATATSKRSVA